MKEPRERGLPGRGRPTVIFTAFVIVPVKPIPKMTDDNPWSAIGAAEEVKWYARPSQLVCKSHQLLKKSKLIIGIVTNGTPSEKAHKSGLVTRSCSANLTSKTSIRRNA